MNRPNRLSWHWAALLSFVVMGCACGSDRPRPADAGTPFRIRSLSIALEKRFQNIARWEMDPGGTVVAVGEGAVPARTMNTAPEESLHVFWLASETSRPIAKEVVCWAWSCSLRSLWFVDGTGTIGVAHIPDRAEGAVEVTMDREPVGSVVGIAPEDDAFAVLIRISEKTLGTEACEVRRLAGTFRKSCTPLSSDLTDVASIGHNTALVVGTLTHGSEHSLDWSYYPAARRGGEWKWHEPARIVAISTCAAEPSLLVQGETSGELKLFELSESPRNPTSAVGPCATDRQDVFLPLVAVGKMQNGQAWEVAFAPRSEDGKVRPRFYRMNESGIECAE